jgi:hypothetical protein
MLIRESVRRCETCDEVTPHSRRVVALPQLLGAALLTVGAWCCMRGEPWWIVGVPALFAGLFALLWDRERFWRVACERCRGKRVEAVRRTRPGLGSTTIIDL